MKSEHWKKVLKDIKLLGVTEAEVEFSDGGKLKVTFAKELPKKVYSAPMESTKSKDIFNEEDLFYSA